MYTAKNDLETQKKVQEAATKIEQSKKEMKLTKSEAKRKSYKIVESNSKNKTIVDKEKQNSIEEKDDETNFYKGIIGGKDYL